MKSIEVKNLYRVEHDRISQEHYVDKTMSAKEFKRLHSDILAATKVELAKEGLQAEDNQVEISRG